MSHFTLVERVEPSFHGATRGASAPLLKRIYRLLRRKRGRAVHGARAAAATACLAALTAGPCLAQVVTKDSSAAPGAGILPTVSDHLGAMPTLYPLDRQPIEQISPLVQRQYLAGQQSTFVKWTVKAGGVFPLHHHSYEQVTWIVSGRCDVFSQGRKFVMVAGDVLIIPPNVPHEFHCPQDTIDIDFFAPQRQDWLDGAPAAAAK